MKGSLPSYGEKSFKRKQPSGSLSCNLIRMIFRKDAKAQGKEQGFQLGPWRLGANNFPVFDIGRRQSCAQAGKILSRSHTILSGSHAKETYDPYPQ